MRIAKFARVLGVVALALALGASLAQAGKGNAGNPGVLPPQSHAHGMTYAQWANAWWQWAFSFPKDVNPMLDLTGEQASLGQSGSVWFLAGTMGGNATRTVTIPTGKALFFPIYNALWINLPDLGDNPWSPQQDAFAREVVAGMVSVHGPEDLACEIDGKSVANLMAYRCPTAPGETFLVDVPANDVWGLVGSTTVGGGIFQPGTYGPAVQDGIYLMVAPLSAGRHTIHFTVSGFLDVTYHLTVK